MSSEPTAQPSPAAARVAHDETNALVWFAGLVVVLLLILIFPNGILGKKYIKKV